MDQRHYHILTLQQVVPEVPDVIWMIDMVFVRVVARVTYVTLPRIIILLHFDLRILVSN